MERYCPTVVLAIRSAAALPERPHVLADSPPADDHHDEPLMEKTNVYQVMRQIDEELPGE
jgi:hypothetical protein